MDKGEWVTAVLHGKWTETCRHNLCIPEEKQVISLGVRMMKFFLHRFFFPRTSVTLPSAMSALEVLNLNLYICSAEVL